MESREMSASNEEARMVSSKSLPSSFRVHPITLHVPASSSSSSSPSPSPSSSLFVNPSASSSSSTSTSSFCSANGPSISSSFAAPSRLSAPSCFPSSSYPSFSSSSFSSIPSSSLGASSSSLYSRDGQEQGGRFFATIPSAEAQFSMHAQRTAGVFSTFGGQEFNNASVPFRSLPVPSYPPRYSFANGVPVQTTQFPSLPSVPLQALENANSMFPAGFKEKIAQCSQRMSMALGPKRAAELIDKMLGEYTKVGRGKLNVPDTSSDLQPEGEADFEDINDVQTYDPYDPKYYEEGIAHPDPLVQSASMAAVDPPKICYSLQMPQSVISKGLLSNAQLESVVYASQAFEQFLPNTIYRRGFFLGDGAGVGKGRQLAGILLENWSKGFKKHIWLSVSTDLYIDAQRDLRDIGAGHIKSIALHKQSYEPIDLKEGIVFVTYSSLIASSGKRKKKSKKKLFDTRLGQLLHWCMTGHKSKIPVDSSSIPLDTERVFEGCILFDECHRAKKFYNGPNGKPSQSGKAVFELQQALPGAKVVYCSATGISQPSNMGYMTRLGVHKSFKICVFACIYDMMLGLWGPRTSFADFENFLDAVEKGGIGMSELVAMHLRRTGGYLCRTLSFETCTFDTIEVNDVNDTFKRVFNEAARLWQSIYLELTQALDENRLDFKVKEPADDGEDEDMLELMDLEGRSVKPLAIPPGKSPKTVVMRYFWGSHQRFFKNLCISLKVSTAVKLAKKALEEGKCAVIGMQSTGESALKQSQEFDDMLSAPDVTDESKDDEDFISSPAITLQNVILKCFPRPPLSSLPPDQMQELEMKRMTKLLNQRKDSRDDGVRKRKCKQTDIDYASDGLEKAHKELQKRIFASHGTFPKVTSQKHQEMLEEGWVLEGDTRHKSAATTRERGYLGQHCRRYYDGMGYNGRVSAVLPAEKNDGISLWHVKYVDDDDSEDVEEDELEGAIREYSQFNTGKKRRKSPRALKRQKISLLSDDESDYNSSALSQSDNLSDTSEDSVVKSIREDPIALRQSVNIPEDEVLCDDKNVFAMRSRFLKRVQALELPGNPLDTLIDHLGGVEAVAELTGRKGRMVRVPVEESSSGEKAAGPGTGKTQLVYMRRSCNGVSLDNQNVHEKELFLNGDKNVAIISEAASSGISLHADRRVKNQRRRVHITLELPWSAERAVQQLGRTHRSNQSSGPEYKLLISPCGGERRFAAAVARRLESLGALTLGDRRASMGSKSFSSSFNLDTKYGKQALDELLVWISKIGDVPAFRDVEQVESFQQDFLKEYAEDKRVQNYLLKSVKEDQLSKFIEDKHLPFSIISRVWLHKVGIEVGSKIEVRRFLNRILGLEIEKQNALFNLFLNRFESITRAARRDGSYDTGVKELAGASVSELRPAETVYSASMDRSSERMSAMLHSIEVDRSIAWEAIQSKFQDSCSVCDEEPRSQARLVKPGFYQSIRSFNGNYFIVFAKEKSDVNELMSINILCYRPQTGKKEMMRSAFWEKYRPVEVSTAEAAWNREYKLNDCRFVTWHLLSGAILPVWKAVATTLKSTRQPVRIMRTFLKKDVHCGDDDVLKSPGEDRRCTEDYRGIIGIWVPNDLVDTLKEYIRVQYQDIEEDKEIEKADQFLADTDNDNKKNESSGQKKRTVIDLSNDL